MSESEKFYAEGNRLMYLMSVQLYQSLFSEFEPSLRPQEDSGLTLDSFWDHLTACAEDDFYFELSGSDVRRLVELLRPVLGK